MKPTTRDNIRYFKCKCCGFVHGEPLDKWRKKPQKNKNICLDCISRRDALRRESVEQARHNPYIYSTMFFKGDM